MATSNPLKSGSDKTAIEKLQTQLFVTEFSAIDERINTCSYWLDFACFGGDNDAVFPKLKNVFAGSARPQRPMQTDTGEFHLLSLNIRHSENITLLRLNLFAIRSLLF